MGNAPRKVELSDDEIKMLIDILQYSLSYCPIEGVSVETRITADKVQDLVAQLEKALKS